MVSGLTTTTGLAKRIAEIKGEVAELEQAKACPQIAIQALKALDTATNSLLCDTVDYHTLYRSLYSWTAAAKLSDSGFIYTPLGKDISQLEKDLYYYGLFHLLLHAVDRYDEHTTSRELSELRQCIMLAIGSFSPDGRRDQDTVYAVKTAMHAVLHAHPTLHEHECFAEITADLRLY